MRLSFLIVCILCLVFVQCVISSDHYHCLQSECICERTRLMCNPHHLEEDQWEELQEIPSTLHEVNLPKFEEADFRYNKIVAVKSLSFQGLHNLNTLWLSHNQVSMIGPHAFNSAAALKSIDLSYNNLETIKRETFSAEPPLLHLRTIDLSHNRITSLDPDCFEAIPNLKELYLHYNPLTNLNGESIANLQLLNTLSLAHSSPREANELIALLEPTPSLRMIFIAGIVEDCTCDWLETMETLKTRNIDIMDEHDFMAHCIETWRLHCDVSHIHQITLNTLRHHAHHTHEITSDDIQPPVVRGNGTLVFPDGSAYELNSVEGKRALYQYDRNANERIGQITDDQKRKSFQDMFKHSMTNFIRKHYVLNGVDATGQNITELSPDEWAASLRGKTANHTSSTASPKPKPPSKTKTRRKGVLTSFIWLILGGLGCGLLVVFLVALKEIKCKDQSIKDPEKEKRKREKQNKKCCGWFGTITGKLSVRKEFVKGTAEKKHAKQKFAKSSQNNFALLHGQAKENMDRIHEGRHVLENFGNYTSPSNHIVPSQQAPPNPSQSSGTSANHGPPPAPPVPPTGLRRTSVDEGIRRMMTPQRNNMNGGQATPSEGSYYFGNFYTDSEGDDDEDVDEETDLFRR